MLGPAIFDPPILSQDLDPGTRPADWPQGGRTTRLRRPGGPADDRESIFSAGLHIKSPERGNC